MLICFRCRSLLLKYFNQFSIDATEEPKSGPQLCRLVNHGDKKIENNAHMKMIVVDNEPHLCLFSSRYLR